MPNPWQIISQRKAEDQLHFVITGQDGEFPYTIEMVRPGGGKQTLHDRASGIQDARRWIARYVYEHHHELPIDYNGDDTIINDRCVKPDRERDAWNQWRLGSYR